MTIHAVDKNMHISNVIVTYRDRPEGSESKLNTVSDGLKVLKTIGSLYRDYRPLQFFGIISAILMILAIVFFIPVVIDYSRIGLVNRYPTLIVCGFAVIAALLAFFAGLILDTLLKKDKREFEFKLNEATRWFKDLTGKM